MKQEKIKIDPGLNRNKRDTQLKKDENTPAWDHL